MIKYVLVFILLLNCAASHERMFYAHNESEINGCVYAVEHLNWTVTKIDTVNKFLFIIHYSENKKK